MARTTYARFAGCALIVALLPAIAARAAVSTAFTYQGRVELNGTAINGTADFEFSLYTSAGGAVSLDTVTVNNVPVTDGLFAVELDFGAEVFSNADRWLAISVRSPAGVGGFTPLTPRQRLTPVPYAIQTRGIFVDDNENVAIGASATSTSKLEVLSVNQRAGLFRRAGGPNNAVSEVLSVSTSSNSPAQPGMGSRISWRSQTNNFSLADLGQIDCVWVDPTVSSTKADMIFRTLEPNSPNDRPERMRITHDGRVLVGRDDTVSNEEVFGVNSTAGTNQFGGMYIRTDGDQGKPFYGYSTNGVVDAYHFYNGVSNQWILYCGGQWLFVNRSNGRVGINDSTPDAQLDVVANGGDGIEVTAISGAALDVNASSFAEGIRITHATDDQIPALNIDASGNAQPIDVTVDGGISNLAKLTLTNSTSISPAVDVQADTDGPAMRVSATNPDGDDAALAVLNSSSNSGGYAIYAAQTHSGSDTAAIFGDNDDTAGDGVGVSGSGGWRGVYGQAVGAGPGSRTGVYGAALTAATTNYGIFGYAVNGTTNWAGWFAGDVNVTGTLSKGGGSFKIDHPLDPENKYLQHSYVESPDMMNVYNGNITTDAQGHAVVELPEWFETLNRDFRYQLTCIGTFAQAIIAEEIEGNRFAIRTDKPGVKVSWQVTGVRQDPWAEQNRIPVELDKPEHERGNYLYPEVYGQSAEAGIAHDALQHPDLVVATE